MSDTLVMRQWSHLKVLFARNMRTFYFCSDGKEYYKTGKKMDAISAEAILQDACVNHTNAISLCRHVQQFFGKGMFKSEKKGRVIFGNNDFPPTVDKNILEDKTVTPYWYKGPEQKIKLQISHILPVEKLSSLTLVDIAADGDCGGGKFRMILK